MTQGIGFINGILYQPFVVPLLLFGAGIWFTIRTGAVQIRMFPEMFRVVMEKPEEESGVSSFAALMISTASRVGTGNIIGVCTAIILGGPGAVFWMWVTATIGGANAFVESTLAQLYKKRDHTGAFYGGPAFYMREGLRQRWLGTLFSVLIIFTYAFGYNMLASYNLQSTFAAFSFYDAKVTPVVIGAVLTLLFGVIVIGGARRLIDTAEFLVPAMGLLYVAVSLLVLVLNARNIGTMFGMIFSGAFDFAAIIGGFTGSCFMWGLKRGLYSNEAGMGSAPNAAARADVSHPVKQGLVQTLSVYLDTILICSATAFMVLSTTGVSGADYLLEGGGANAAGYIQACMHTVLGGFGPVFIAVSMSLFAFTTLIGNYSYCEPCLNFILKRDASERELLVFRVLATALVFLGAVSSAGLVWDMADMAQGLMVVTNIPVIAILGNKAVRCLRDYTAQKARGEAPVFRAENIGMKDEVDCWK